MPPSSRELPIYLQIVDHLTSKIHEGKFVSGDRLPSETELAEQFKTTRATVARGLRELVFEGVITREVGKGSFVANDAVTVHFQPMPIMSFEEQVGVERGPVTYRLIQFKKIKATPDVAAALSLRGNQALFQIRRVRIVQGVPLSLVTRYVPQYIGERLTNEGLQTLSIHRMLADMGWPVAFTEGRISAVAANRRDADLMDIKPSSPVLERVYILRGSDGAALVYGRSLFRQEFQISYSVSSSNKKSVLKASVLSQPLRAVEESTKERRPAKEKRPSRESLS
jgi:GntR family transcriptional regulator